MITTIRANRWLGVRIPAGLALGLAGVFCQASEPVRFENPVPATVSPQAQQFLASLHAPTPLALPAATDHAGWRKIQQDYETRFAGAMNRIREQYDPQIRSATYAGVPVLDIRPRGYKSDPRVVIFVHGGGYVMGSAASSLDASVPMANDSGLRIISVDYSLAPETPYDSMIDQVIRVIEAVIKEGHPPSSLAVMGASAGGGLATGSLLRMQAEGKPLPAALLLWSPAADLAMQGETMTTLARYEPAFDVSQAHEMLGMVAPPGRLTDPVVSPVHGKFGPSFPPTLIQGGTREVLLSGFVRLYQAIDTQGGMAKLDLYEGMVHTFQEIRPDLPESRLARRKCAEFLIQHLKR